MATVDEPTWLQARIDRTRELIVLYEDALAALAGGAQSYSLDTGQTRQSVTKADLGSMKLMLDHLENRLSTLLARRNGAGVRGKPVW